MVRINLGGTDIIETPEGWENLVSTLKIDQDLKALYEVVDVSLTFYEDGYRLLKSLYDSNGYCYSLPTIIYRLGDDANYKVVFNGTLFFKDIEFSEGIEAYGAKCKFSDNSFFSKIRNNRNIKAKPYVGLSKSGISIPQADYWRTTFFQCSSGSYYSHITGAGYERQDTSFKVYDILRFLVDYMSDGEVEFRSEFFNTGGEAEGDMITCGLVPRFTSGAIGVGITQELFEENFPDLSFSDVFKELDKIYNLGIQAGYDGAKPFIKIERATFLHPDNTLMNLPNVATIKRMTASDLLPAKVKIGSETITDESFLSFPAKIRFMGMNSEEYAVVNDCNGETEVDLVNTWIIDTNTIEDLVENGATTAPTSYDSTIVLIRTILDVTNVWGDAVQSNWLTNPAPYYYNEAFINSKKAERNLGGIPANIAAYLSTTDDTFTSESSAVDPLVGYYTKSVADEKIVQADVELTDPSNNYDPANFRYTSVKDGVYTFFGSVNVELFEFIGFLRAEDITLFIRRTNSSNVTLSDTPISTVTRTTPANSSTITGLSGSVNVVMSATDRAYLWVKISGPDIQYRVFPMAQFQCIGTSNGGGVYQSYDPKEMPIIRNQFAYPLSFAEYLSLKANPLGLLSFGVNGGKTYFAWIEELKYKHFQADSQFTLISNEKNN